MIKIELNQSQVNLLLKCVTVRQSYHMGQKSDAEELIQNIEEKFPNQSTKDLNNSIVAHMKQIDELFNLWKLLSL